MTMDARLGYRDKGDPISNWTEIARSSEERSLKCEIQKVCNNGEHFKENILEGNVFKVNRLKHNRWKYI